MYHQSSVAPPPPPPPPPLLAPPVNNNSVSKGKNSTPDRNALLAQIRSGKTLKKAVTNDKSAPQINNSKSSGGSGNINNKIQNDPLGLGNIFAQGKPKLRPSFKTDCQNTETTKTKQDNKQYLSINLSKNVSLSSPINKQQFGKSNIPQLNSNDSCQKTATTNNLNSPMKVIKPTPPPASSKPNININSKLEISQTNNNLGRSSNAKPLPPPKNLESSKFATIHHQINKTEKYLASPKLPVRNNSSPDNLNELAKSNVSKINTLCPPTVKRSTSTGSRQQQIRAPNYRPPPPPPIRNTPSSASSVPPPVPKRSIAVLSTSNLNSTANNLPPPPPPPPLRTTSKNYLMGHDFETRFNNSFHKIQEFPLPLYQQTSCKLYISQVETADLKNQKNIKAGKEIVRSIEC